jgi:phosphoribosylformylglycinamidine cyclo-ligase
VDRSSWRPAPVFDLVRDVGQVAETDLELTLNMGVGMVAVVAPDSADAALGLLAEAGTPSWICGEVTDVAGGQVTLIGRHT